MADATSTLLFGARGNAWRKLVEALRREGRTIQQLEQHTEPAEIGAQARDGDTVVVVDLSPDFMRGMEVVSACRRQAPNAPVIVVAPDLSIDMARSIRAGGVFYLAIEPLDLEELRTALDNAQQSIARNKPSTSTCTTKAKVLVVDDDRDFTSAVAALLESEGYAVLCAESGREGLDKVMSEKPALLVLDIMMEDEWAGYLVNQAMKFKPGFEEVRHIPILMVSSVPVEPETRFAGTQEAAMVSPDAYLTKPIDSREFLALVKLLIGRSRSGPTA